ncbi:GNAT family N-acetyltransferase [Aureibaculum conchae]|uniref:GNAT family N-acetyltransferase n=1 Tax=Aureibaculum sp. 2308TA14-22 TaxID=3108392 RepID=UPI003390D182
MNTQHLQIRKATLNDLTTLKQFEQELIKYERPFAPNLKDDPISYYHIEDFIISNDAQLLVAVINNELVGSGYALIKNSASYKKPDQFAYLGFMYVSPNHRGKGINGKLTHELITWAATQGISEIQLDVYANNSSAINAYKKIGLQPDLLKMRMEINDNK